MIPLLTSTALATTLTVGPNQQFPTVWTALIVAQPGDAVAVDPGVYVEHIVIDTEIDLYGTGPGVVLQADGVAPEVILAQADARIANVEIDGAGVATGVHADGTVVRLEGVEVHDTVGHGVYGASGLTVVDSTFVGGDRGLGVTGEVTVVGSTFAELEQAVYLWYTNDGTIRGNRFFDNQQAVTNTDGPPCGSSYGNVVLVQNTFIGNGDLAQQQAAVTLAWNAAYLVKNNVFAGNEVGLALYQDPAQCPSFPYSGLYQPPVLFSDYNLWFANRVDTIEGEYDAALDSYLPVGPAPLGAHEIFGVDPQYTVFSDDGDWRNDVLTPLPTSPLIDSGNPRYSDPDGTVSDIGHHTVP